MKKKKDQQNKRKTTTKIGEIGEEKREASSLRRQKFE